jgi:hypothetical protein
VQLLPYKHSCFAEPLLGNGSYSVAYFKFNISCCISQLKKICYVGCLPQRQKCLNSLINLLPARSCTFLRLKHVHLRRIESVYNGFIRNNIENLRSSPLAYGDDALVQYAYSKSIGEKRGKFCFSKQFQKFYFGYRIP